MPAKIEVMGLKHSQSERDRCDTMEKNYLLSKIMLKYYNQEGKSSLAGRKLSALKEGRLFTNLKLNERYYLK